VGRSFLSILYSIIIFLASQVRSIFRTLGNGQASRISMVIILFFKRIGVVRTKGSSFM